MSASPAVIGCILLLYFTFSARAIRIITMNNQELRLRAGSKVKLDCQFISDDIEDFNLFDNPISWIKRQLDEETQINMMGNTLHPFAHDDRFRLWYENNATSFTHLLRLTIKNLIAEDTGNYTCLVHGSQNIRLAHISYQLTILRRPKTVELRSSIPQPISSHFLELSTGLLPPGGIACRAHGSYPLPTIRLTLGSRDTLGHLAERHEMKVEGERGLRLLGYESIVELHRFNVSQNDDGSVASCVVNVEGEEVEIIRTQISVNYGPIVKCHDTFANLKDSNVMLSCLVSAKPDLISLYWLLDGNNSTAIRLQDDGDNFFNFVRVLQDGSLSVALVLRDVERQHFRTYTLFAENIIYGKYTSARIIQNETSKTGWTKSPSVENINVRSYLQENYFTTLISNYFADGDSCAIVTTSFKCYMLFISTLLYYLTNE